MVITVNTDASFSRNHQIGAYAFWINSDNFKIQQSGMLRKKVTDPTHAECMCILNALHVVFQQENLSKVYMIIVNTDSMNAINVFTSNKKNIHKYGIKKHWQKYHGRFQLIRFSRGEKVARIRIDFRHVKAHSGINDRRSHVNEWCDREAKKHMGERLKQIDKKKNGSNSDSNIKGQ